MEAQYADLNLVGYLYNTCHGGFEFSEEFKKRMNDKRVAAGLQPLKYFREERVDPEYIALFKELGARASSGYCARLAIAYFPEEFLEFVVIDEYDGRESVAICQAEVYEALLKRFMEERAHGKLEQEGEQVTLEDLDARYIATKAKLERYAEYKRNKAEEEDNDY
jgi:hypothetical protein